jgi:transcriptional regulator with XRE-family HTH domain
MAKVSYRTPGQLEAEFGDGLRALRLGSNLDQSTVAKRAGVSESALKNLEAGRGTLHTLVRVVRALGREDWLLGVAPPTPINPLNMTREATPRRRASRRK